jgi:error-prone DNA polymerase
VADRNTLAGVVRVHVEAEGQPRPVIGCRLVLLTGEEFLAYPRDRAAYGRLSRLLSKGKMRDAEGTGSARAPATSARRPRGPMPRGSSSSSCPPADLTGFPQRLKALSAAFPHCVTSRRATSTAATTARGSTRSTASPRGGPRILATNDVLYHEPARRPLQDVMTCIREKVRLPRRASCSSPTPSGT